ncbi:MAG: flagellar basal body-associated FliL family protein [Planctomycetes bacterium]|nr:flagellar basal body-associated FliL family protein [Planctomycetota bacterium]
MSKLQIVSSIPTWKGIGTTLKRGMAVSLGFACAFLCVSKGYASLPGNLPADQEMLEAHWTEEHIDLHREELPGGEMIAVSSAPKKEEKAEEVPLIIPVDTIVVNLSGSNARRYLKAKVNLEAKDAETKKKIETKTIPIKDRLISILSSKTLEDIDGLEGQESLRVEIKNNIDSILKIENGVLQVYFSEFVVQ